MNIDSPISEVKGVGAERQKYLKKLNIEKVRDVLDHYPRDYEDRTTVTPIAELLEDKTSVIIAFAKEAPKTSYFKGMAVTQTKVFDKSGGISLMWYNQPYAKNMIKPNLMYAFIGKLTVKNKRRYIISPEFEAMDEGGEWNGKLVPVYPLTVGLSQKVFRKIVESVLTQTGDQINEYIPFEIRKRYKLSGRKFAVKNIHEPDNMENYELARKRLVFDEFFMLQMSLLRIKAVNDSRVTGIRMKKMDMKQFFDSLSFSFTDAQEKVFREIRNDMSKSKVMNRLVQGDVGSGKTAVAMAAAYMTVKNGFQAVMMAPTEVLAAQHLESFKATFEPLEIKILLLTGGLKAKEKREALAKISSGEADIIIGTHALIQDKVEFLKIGLVITDEQHRFGVRQRQMLSDKGNNPHVLVMTATPIPRTLALILYGDLDISIIDSMPPGRQKISTYSVNTSFRSRIYSFIDKQVENGSQAYIICPMVEENEKIEAESVIEYAEKLNDTVLSKRRIAFVHGRMKSGEKDIILKDFAAGKTDILISTTVIEVGINVPNATVMLVENAERFGLAQLHQLRGRVGRGSAQSYCVLLTDGKNKITDERMKVMTSTTDGFLISETDLKLRGPGEFFGTRQHGLPNLKIANMFSDMYILKNAQSAAEQIMLSDENLEKEENFELKKELNRDIITTNLGI
ncbi:MAG: ATP-dependent DNA helicase RecG [Candidatus Metalachnospira sp.]|nr:ATP-dependent DNA helicase RecG [Candidatus Metalachnospira sp.]